MGERAGTEASYYPPRAHISRRVIFAIKPPGPEIPDEFALFHNCDFVGNTADLSRMCDRFVCNASDGNRETTRYSTYAIRVGPEIETLAQYDPQGRWRPNAVGASAPPHPTPPTA